MHTLIQDIRFGLRVLAKKPGFTVVAVLALALGIGANTAIFSVVNAVLLRQLPYDNPDRLMVLWGDNTVVGSDRDPVAYPNFADWRAQSESFEQLAAVTPGWGLTVTGIETPERTSGFMVSSDFFSMMGVAAAHGRTFLPEEGEAGNERVALLSHGFWQRVYGGDAGILGRTVTINRSPFTIVGVLPPDFRFLEEVDLWLPISPAQIDIDRFVSTRFVRLFHVAGRLKPGVTPEAAQAEMNAIAARLQQQYPDTNTGLGIRMVRLHDEITGDIRPALLILFAAVGLVLLIACANVANLALTRTSARQKEVAVRTALGAGRGRLIRQLLTESVLLALLGGAAGLLLAFWGVDALLALSPDTLPRQDMIGIDGAVLGFTFVVALLTGIIFGLAPAIQASRLDQYDTLKEGGRTALSGSTRFRNGLVVVEIAMALVLLIGAGLLIRSFMRVLDADPGFRTDSMLTMSMSLPRTLYGDNAQQRVAFWRELENRIANLPGVTTVGQVTRLPMYAPDNNITTTLTIEGRPTPEGEKPEVDFRRASPDYFRTMGIPLLQGRGFAEQDIQNERPTAIVNQAMAQRYFPGEDPVGKRIKLGANTDDDPWMTIVGVVGNVRHTGLDIAPRPEVYRHLMTSPPFGPIWAISTSVAPASLIPAIQSQVHSMDPDIPLNRAATMDDLIDRTVVHRRFLMTLLGVFAGVALLLAAVGVYGVMAYAVAQRTHEIGVRMALGARPGDVLRLVVGQGMALALGGVLLGVVAAFGLTRLMASLLYGVTATDPVTFVGIALLLALVALAANYLPARRAARVDPMIALRYE